MQQRGSVLSLGETGRWIRAQIMRIGGAVGRTDGPERRTPASLSGGPNASIGVYPRLLSRGEFHRDPGVRSRLVLVSACQFRIAELEDSSTHSTRCVAGVLHDGVMRPSGRCGERGVNLHQRSLKPGQRVRLTGQTPSERRQLNVFLPQCAVREEQWHNPAVQLGLEEDPCRAQHRCVAARGSVADLTEHVVAPAIDGPRGRARAGG